MLPFIEVIKLNTGRTPI